MVKHEIMIIGEGLQSTVLSVEELCEICHISADVVHDLIAYDIIHAGPLSERQSFTIYEVQRVKTALRLQQDLEINLAGIALVLDLLDELQDLRATKQVLEKLLSLSGRR